MTTPDLREAKQPIALDLDGDTLTVERLANALALTEVGCWANKPVHGPDQDDEVHRRDAEAILAALRDTP